MNAKPMKRRPVAKSVPARGPTKRGPASASERGKTPLPDVAVANRAVKPAKARTPLSPHRPAKLWQLRLYVTGQTIRSQTAFANLKQICETHLKDRYRITVIDLLKHPQLAQGDQILAVPTVVRRLPKPVRIIFGNLSDAGRVLVGLDLRAAANQDKPS